MTTNTDKGAGTQGTHSATTFYNNAAGNSYQMVARNGTNGPDILGAVIFAGGGQCDFSEPFIPSTFNHNENSFNLEISQAQCSGDLTDFVITHPAHGAGGTATVNVTIFDGTTGTAVLVFDESQMFSIGSVDQFRHFSLAFTPGPYAALALHDDLVATADWFDGGAFNVPRGTCIDTPADFGPTNSLIRFQANQTNTYVNATNATLHNDHLSQDENLTAVHVHIDSHFNTTNGLIVFRTSQTNGYVNGSRESIISVIGDLNLEVDCGEGGSGNCTFEAQSIIDLPAMTDVEVGAFLLFLIMLIISFFQRWLFVAIASLIGILEVVLLGDVFGANGFKFTALLLVLGIVLQILVDHRDAMKEKQAEREGGESGS